MSLAVVYSRALAGMDAPPVTVEAHLANGLPSFTIVGLPEAEVKEAKDRVRAALQNARFEFPARRITVNLAPADLPKESGRFDLPIALGILAASGQLPAERARRLRVRRRAGADRRAAAGPRRAGDGALGARASGRAFVLPEAERARGGAGRGGDGLSGALACSRSAPTSPGARRSRAARERPAVNGCAPPRPAGGERAAARQARARDRRRGRAQPDHGRAAGHRQDHARGAPARDPAADDARGGARRGGDAVARQRGLRHRELGAGGRSARRTTPRPRWRWSAAAAIRARARSRWRCTACCSSTSCRSSTARCWKCCASRSSRAASASRAPRARRSFPPSSSWWRR